MKSLTTFVKLNPGHLWPQFGLTSPATPPEAPKASAATASAPKRELFGFARFDAALRAERAAGTQAQPAQQRDMPAGFGLQRFMHAVQRERRGDRRQLAQRELTPAQLAIARTPSKD